MKRLVCLTVSCMFLIISTAFAEISFNASGYSLTELMEIRAVVDEQIYALTSTPSKELQPGKYIVGIDIAAGSYIIRGLMDKGPSGYTPQILFAESMDHEYLYYEYLKTNEKWYLNAAEGNIIEVRSGSVAIEKAPIMNCASSTVEAENKDSHTTTVLVPGFYTAGKDIVTGSYILQGLMDKGPGGYTPQALVANSMDDAQYSEYSQYEYLRKGSNWRIRLETGNVLEIRNGDICISEVVPLAFAPSEEEYQKAIATTSAKIDDYTEIGSDEGIPVVKGVYTAGSDIKAGSYTLTMTDCQKGTIIATFSTMDNLTSYTSWNSANNLKEYGKTALYVKKNVPVHIFLEEGDILYVENGQGYLVESTNSTILKGAYIAGTDLAPGSHVITLAGFKGSTIIATFKSSKDMLSYVTWDSSNNLKEYGKTAIYAKADTPVHISVEEGDILYITDGIGTISDYQEGTLIKGVYAIGNDLKPGSYLITLNDFHNYAIVATFANFTDLISYISWDSTYNLE